MPNKISAVHTRAEADVCPNEGRDSMNKVWINCGIIICVIAMTSLFASCKQKTPLTAAEIRANFIKSVTDEVGKSSIKVDFRVEETTLYMIDKSETTTGINILERSLKKNDAWVEDPNSTFGYLGSSLRKLGFTHYVWWSSKYKRINNDELKSRPNKNTGP